MMPIEVDVCPECGATLDKEPYEEYVYCHECGWDEINGPLVDVDLPPTAVDADDDDVFQLDDDEEFHDPNLDPEAGEDA